MADSASIRWPEQSVLAGARRGRDSGVVDALVALIESEGLGVGDRLPPEIELAERLGVARSSIREVLKSWQSMGIVTRNKGAGTTLSAEISSRSIHLPLTESWSLSFRAGDRHVVFSGDTAHNPALVAFAQGADLLVHEAMLAEGLAALQKRIGNGDDRLMKHWLRAHTLAEDVARTAKSAGVKALALHHLIPSDDPAFGPTDWHRAAAPHWTGPLHVGHDGMRIYL